MRALLTRPLADARELAELLRRRGIEAVVEPLIEIVDRAAPLPDPVAVQAILCTSANGARALARVSDARDTLVLAVGDATARAAREAGFSAVESAGGDAGDLARLVRRRLDPGGGRLLHVAGRDVAGDLAGALRESGFAVDRVVLYEARAAAALSPATARLIADGGIDLALFYSPRSAAIFARLVEAAGVARGLGSAVALALSRAADAALGGLPFHTRAVADTPDQAALLALVDRFARQPA